MPLCGNGRHITVFALGLAIGASVSGAMFWQGRQWKLSSPVNFLRVKPIQAREELPWCVQHDGRPSGELCSTDFYPLVRAPCYAIRTSSSACLPSLYIAGNEKSGTTALYDMLLQHPNVKAKTEIFKEKHYWDAGLFWNLSKPPQYTIGIRGYEKFFPDFSVLGNDSITMDATPTLINSAQYDITTPRRIKAFLPWVKTIVLVRNPISWYWSWYLYFGAGCPDYYAKHAEWVACSHNKTARQAEERRRTSDFSKPEYWTRIFFKATREWMRCFPLNEQLIVLRNEDLLTKHDEVIDIVVDFLSLPGPGHKFIKSMKTNIGATKSNLGFPPIVPSQDIRANEGLLKETLHALCHDSRPAFNALGQLVNMNFTDYYAACP